MQSAGEDRAGDLEGDGDLVRHLSHETRGAIAGLQVLWLFTINDLGDSRCEMIDGGRQTILSPPPPPPPQGLHERRRGGDQENRRLRQPDGEPWAPQSATNQEWHMCKEAHRRCSFVFHPPQNFYKSEVNKEDMYIRYIHKLCDLHLQAEDFTGDETLRAREIQPHLSRTHFKIEGNKYR